MATTSENAPPATPYVDNPHAPEVFAEGATGFLLFNGNVHITLTAPRSNYGVEPPIISRVVIGRLVMPLNGAQNLAVGLYDFLKSRGFEPAEPVPGQKVQ